MENLTFAIATLSDGNTLTKEHFGDAQKFVLYKLINNQLQFDKIIDNSALEIKEQHHEHHGDPQKAKGIGSLMKQYNVNVLVGRAFGPNIKKMTPQFAVIIVNTPTVEQTLPIIQKNLKNIIQVWKQGENRKHLVLRQ